MRTLFWTGALLGGLLLPVEPAWAQFNPQGRQKKPPAGRSTPSPGTRAGPTTTKTPPPIPARPSPNGTGPSIDTLIERYRRLVLDKPGEALPIQRLAELTWERQGSLDSLLQDFSELARTPGKDQYAAQLALGALQERAGKLDEARQSYTAASQLDGKRPDAWRELARVATAAGDAAAAERALARALPLVHGPERDLVLRALRKVSLDLDQLDEAREYQEALYRGANGQVFVAGELGRELLERGKTREAVDEFRAVEKRLGGDARIRASLLRDLGRAELAQGDYEQAEQTLGRASRVASPNSGIAREIDLARAEVARQLGRLPELAASWSAENSGGTRLRLLGQLQEELGNPSAAMQSYRKALAKSPSDLDSRLDLLRLLELSGQLDEADAEYRALSRAAPSDMALGLRFMDALLRRGHRDEALREFERLERMPLDVDARLALVDFAERIEEPERAARLLSRLDQTALSDPKQLVELGARYYREGNSAKAHEIWQRLPVLAAALPPDEKARLLVLYGEVLLDHDDAAAGVAALAQATKLTPSNVKVRRSLGLGLQRAATLDAGPGRARLGERATSVWLELSREPSSKDTERAEARRHVVRLWQRSDRLASELPALRKRLSAAPPDIEAGRLLVEAELKLGLNEQAENTLGALLKELPGDRQSLESLATLRERLGRGGEALNAWDRLIDVDPERARLHLERAMRLANKLHLDERALRYGERRVALTPLDASAQAGLAELYRLQGKYPEARRALERAHQLDPRRDEVSMALSELCIQTGDEACAAPLLLDLIAKSPDEALVGRAVHKAIGLGAARAGTPNAALASLDELLLRLAIEHSTKPLYRSLLLEVYETERQALARMLVDGDAETRARAERALGQLGRRALTPLLGVLAGPRTEEHRAALSLLSWAPSQSSALALIEYARGSTPEPLRVQALLGIGRVDDPAVVAALGAMLAPGTAYGGRVVQAVARAVAQLQSERARPSLVEALMSRDPYVQSYALLGLASLPNATNARVDPKLRARVEAILADETNGSVGRAASALCLGAFSGSEASLEAATVDSEPLVRSAALRAWARSNSAERTTALERALVNGLVSSDAAARQAAATSAALFVASPQEREVLTRKRSVPLDSAALDPRAEIEQELGRPAPARARVVALLRLETAYVEQARLVLSTSGASARSLLERLSDESGRLALSPLDQALGESEPELAERGRAAIENIHRALSPAIAVLAAGADPSSRALALRLLPSSELAPEAFATWRAALFGDLEAPRDAAIERLGQDGSLEAIALLSELGQKSALWSARRRVAVALGKARLEPRKPAERQAIEEALERMGRDPSAIVARAARLALEARP